LPIRVTRVESSRDEPRWRETVVTGPDVSERDGVYQRANHRYLAHWPDANDLDRLFADMAHEAGIATTSLPAELRIRQAGDLVFAFNYGLELLTLDAAHDYVIGGPALAPAAVAVWRSVG
jgi:beta-galactosidase